MYPILRYMWGTDSYRQSIKVSPETCMCVCSSTCAAGTALELQPFSRSSQALADYASENLEAMNPPLFLRFLNLLMNDAIFLLDEAIQVGLSCRCHVGNRSGCLKTRAALLRGTQPGSRRPLWFVIIKSLGLLAGVLSSQRVVSRQLSLGSARPVPGPLLSPVHYGCLATTCG